MTAYRSKPKSIDSTLAYVIKDGAKAVLLTPYESDFVDDLKGAVPARYRTWDPSRHVWTVSEPYIDDAIELVSSYFHLQMLQPLRIPSARPDHNATECLKRVRAEWSEWAVLNLLPHAHPAVVRAAYHALSTICHPDVGGDHEAMARLNAAHERILDQERN